MHLLIPPCGKIALAVCADNPYGIWHVPNQQDADLNKPSDTRVGVTRQTINAIETGRYDPSLPLAINSKEKTYRITFEP